MIVRLHSLRVLGGSCLLGLALMSPLVGQSPAGGELRERADTLRLLLGEARKAALGANYTIVAARLDTAVARGELRQAGLLLRFNPAVDVLGASGGNGLEAGVSQEIEIFGQQASRAAAARAGLTRAAAGVANVTRLTIGDVDRAFYRLYSASRRKRLAEEVLGVTERIADAAGRQLSSGEISRLDFNLATVELGRNRARALAAGRERESAAIQLLLLLGLPRNTSVEPILDSTVQVPAEDTSSVPARVAAAEGRTPLEIAELEGPDLDSLTALALAQRPDLAASEAAVRQAEGEARTAGREALPNIVARGLSEPRDQASGRVFRPGVGLSLPIFNRNRGRIQAFRAAARQADLERAGTVALIRADIAAAVASYRAATAEVRVLEATVLTPARQNRRLVEIAFREGKVGLPELLLIRNQAIDAEQEYWTAWLAEREAATAITEATAANLASLPAPGAR